MTTLCFLWQGEETVPKIYVEHKVTGAKSDGEGLVTLPDRPELQLKEFKFASLCLCGREPA